MPSFVSPSEQAYSGARRVQTQQLTPRLGGHRSENSRHTKSIGPLEAIAVAASGSCVHQASISSFTASFGVSVVDSVGVEGSRVAAGQVGALKSRLACENGRPQMDISPRSASDPSGANVKGIRPTPRHPQ